MVAPIFDAIVRHLEGLGAPAGRISKEIEELTLAHPWLAETATDENVERLARAYDVLDDWLRGHGTSFNELSSGVTDGSDDQPTHDEFAEAYEVILEVLTLFGKHDPFGRGDFHLVEDRCLTRELLLEVNAPARLTGSAISKLKQILAVRLSKWKLIIRGVAPHDIVLSTQAQSER